MLMFTVSPFKLSVIIMVENTLLAFFFFSESSHILTNFFNAAALQLVRLSLIRTNVKTANCVTECHAVGLIMLLVQVPAA